MLYLIVVTLTTAPIKRKVQGSNPSVTKSRELLVKDRWMMDLCQVTLWRLLKP